MVCLVCPFVGWLLDKSFNFESAEATSDSFFTCAVVNADGTSLTFAEVVDAHVAVLTACFEPPSILDSCGPKVFLARHSILVDCVPKRSVYKDLNYKFFSLTDGITQSAHRWGSSRLRHKSRHLYEKNKY